MDIESFGLSKKANDRFKQKQKIQQMLKNIDSSDLVKQTNKQLKTIQFCLGKIVTATDDQIKTLHEKQAT